MTFKIVSLFSGCGGMDLGFKGGFCSYGEKYKKNPFEIVWANEINPYACATYEKNLGHKIQCGDIWDCMKDLSQASEVDIVIGGFPCQDISINNTRAKGVFGERSGLYRAMVEVVKKTQPIMFVAENVKALLHKNNARSLRKVIADFSSLGYKVTYRLYNAADFGVSQTRQRVFIVGSKEREFVHPDPILSEKEWVSVEKVISDLESINQDAEWSHIWSLASPGGEQGRRRLYADRPGYTMRAECHGNTHYHYKLPRRISMREGARIQSFPDDFIFLSKLRETERQVGNSVPPVLAWHLAQAIRNHLHGKNAKRKDGYQLSLKM